MGSPRFSYPLGAIVNPVIHKVMQKFIELLKKATFSILFPHESIGGLPYPKGTGFFVSEDGWFITAAHVVTKPDGSLEDFNDVWLMKEQTFDGSGGEMCQGIDMVYINHQTDIAILKVDFEKNREKDWLRKLTGFPHLSISNRKLEDGEQVYSFGYPLSSFQMTHDTPDMVAGGFEFSPRLTSAIISSGIEKTTMLMSKDDLKTYVLDKALNYGNSGGPIISSETGNVYAYCSRFQPVEIPQHHLRDQLGNPLKIMIPSLYGIVTRFDNKSTIEKMEELGINIIKE